MLAPTVKNKNTDELSVYVLCFGLALFIIDVIIDETAPPKLILFN